MVCWAMVVGNVKTGYSWRKKFPTHNFFSTEVREWWPKLWWPLGTEAPVMASFGQNFFSAACPTFFLGRPAWKTGMIALRAKRWSSWTYNFSNFRSKLLSQNRNKGEEMDLKNKSVVMSTVLIWAVASFAHLAKNCVTASLKKNMFDTEFAIFRIDDQTEVKRKTAQRSSKA